MRSTPTTGGRTIDLGASQLAYAYGSATVSATAASTVYKYYMPFDTSEYNMVFNTNGQGVYSTKGYVHAIYAEFYYFKD